eukprot:COSAG01_NODE_2426_length_7722_cov_2.700905_3_plen_80_part_00
MGSQMMTGHQLGSAQLALTGALGCSATHADVSCRYPGSPASVSGPPPTTRIVELDGTPTLDLDSFLSAAKGVEVSQRSV